MAIAAGRVLRGATEPQAILVRARVIEAQAHGPDTRGPDTDTDEELDAVPIHDCVGVHAVLGAERHISVACIACIDCSEWVQYS